MVSSPNPSLAARVDAVIDGALAAERIVGTVVLVARDGETIHARAAGFADREAGVPMRADALFRLASVSKPFTAAAVLALAARGRLGLDRPVTDWLPDFAPTFEGRPARITLRHLLAHTLAHTRECGMARQHGDALTNAALRRHAKRAPRP